MAVNLGQTIRGEIIPKKVTKKCCKIAFLSGVIRGAGSLTIEREGLGFSILHSNIKLIDKCADIIFVLIRQNANVIKKDKTHTIGHDIMYELQLDAVFAKPIMQDLGLIDSDSLPIHTIPKSFRTDCCMRSYLRGIFATSGTLSIPEILSHGSRGYFLELLLNDVEIANAIKSLLDECNIETKVRQRKNVYSVYTKDSEKIADFCTLLGASQAFFNLQDVMVTRSIRNEANRTSNCTIANIERSIRASSKHIDAISKIEEAVGLDSLDPALKETAILRRDFPEATLNELATKFITPPSKSGLNHRLNKLLEIADKLKI